MWKFYSDVRSILSVTRSLIGWIFSVTHGIPLSVVRPSSYPPLMTLVVVTWIYCQCKKTWFQFIYQMSRIRPWFLDPPTGCFMFRLLIVWWVRSSRVDLNHKFRQALNWTMWLKNLLINEKWCFSLSDMLEKPKS